MLNVFDILSFIYFIYHITYISYIILHIFHISYYIYSIFHVTYTFNPHHDVLVNFIHTHTNITCFILHITCCTLHITFVCYTLLLFVKRNHRWSQSPCGQQIWFPPPRKNVCRFIGIFRFH